MYNKIIEQSKESYFFEKLEFENSLNFELFKINLIFILWYMKSKNLEERYLDFIINKFVNDIEAALIESGFGESGLKKEVRKLVKDFYNSLNFNINLIESYILDKKKSDLKLLIESNYKHSCTNLKGLENYYKNNIKLFLNLDIKDFWDLDFLFVIE